MDFCQKLFNKNSNAIVHEEQYKSKVLLKQESFYLLGFVSWLHHFDDLSHWEFRAGNNGFFALASIAFLFAQMIILFDLAYEEDHLSYKCQGNSARLAVVVCGALVTLLVAMKMLAEERRSLGQRLVLIRYATKFPLLESLRGLLFGEERLRSLKLLLFTIFHGFRQYGVIVFVYVAVIEQLMLFDTILEYIINSVVVLVIAELDELAFHCLARVELSLKGGDTDGEGEGGGRHYGDGLLHPSSVASTVDSHPHLGSVASSHSHHNTIEQYLLKTEEGLVSSHPLHTNNNNQRMYVRNSNDDHNINNSSVSIIRDNFLLHQHPANIHEMTTLNLSRREYEAYLTFDYFIVRFNFIAMLIPLLNAKITGNNCGRNSVFRVSEIGMFALLVMRALLNVYVDTMLTRSKVRSLGDNILHVVGSILEHAIPAVGYVALMYLVFVDKIKPPMDDPTQSY